MLSGLIEWSLANRALVIALFVLMSLGGLYAATHVPVDAVPDLVNIQVQIVTEAGAAYRAGIRTGDEIVSVNGRAAGEFRWPETLNIVVQAGQVLKLEIRREGKGVKVEVNPEMVVK